MAHWIVNLEGGPRRVNHAAISAGHKVFSFGGYCTGDDYEHTKPIDVHILNTVTLRWRLLPQRPEDENNVNIPYKRYGHIAVNYEDQAYIWGGRNDSEGACDVLFRFDTATYTWSRPNVLGNIPPSRDGHSACVLDHRMFIFGGFEEVNEMFSDQVYALAFRTLTWYHVRAYGTPARCRDFHTATALGRKMYIYGGRSDEGGENFTNRENYDNDMHTFDIDTCTWETLPPPAGFRPVGRRSHSTFEYNGSLYVFGGYNGLLDEHFSDLYRYNVDTKEWSVVFAGGKGPCPRRRQCCCVMDSKVFLFGGTSPRPPDAVVPLRRRRRFRSSELIDHADLHVLDFEPSLKMLCLLTVIKHNLGITELPDSLRWEFEMMTEHNTISREENTG